MALYKTVNGVKVQMTAQEEADTRAEWAANDAAQAATKSFSDKLLDIQNRVVKIQNLRAYLRLQITNDATYETVDNQLGSHINSYLNGSNRIIEWIKGSNTTTYGNFSTTGFPSKAYFTTQRQTDILAILS